MRRCKQVPTKCILISVVLFIITFQEAVVLTDDRREVIFVRLDHFEKKERKKERKKNLPKQNDFKNMSNYWSSFTDRIHLHVFLFV